MAMRLIVGKISVVGWLIRKHHISFAHFMIETKGAFVKIILINNDSKTMLHVIINAPKIKKLSRFNNLIIILLE